jgi:LysM repeat protein
MKLSSRLKEILTLLLIMTMVVFAVSLTSCSKSPDDPDSTDETEMSEDGEDMDNEDKDEEGEDEDDLADEEGEDEESDGEEDLASEEAEESSDELFADEGSSDEALAEEEAVPAEEGGTPEEAAVAQDLGGDAGVYTVQRGDTLLKISFKVFQTYYKWKDLMSMNPDIQDPNVIEVGQQIKYPSEYKQRVVASVEDEYKIQRGDTLGTISEKFYGTKEQWRNIWKLNNTKVVNPNQIFYGTTLNVTLPGVSKVDPNSAPQEEYVEEAPVEEEAVAEEPVAEEEVIEEEVIEEEPVEEEVIEE